MSAASVTFESISYAYSGAGHAVQAVSGVTLAINPGELVVLVGPSGCGKSTLLKLTAGLLTPTGGRLLIDGVDTINQPPHQRQIGWVPQSYGLFDHLTVAENIEFGLRMQRRSQRERRERVQAMLALGRITELAARPISGLSGGQRQRVAIARALAVNPRVLLLDEPLAALDPQLRSAVRDDLVALLRASGVTTLFVTHDQDEALAIADRVAVLRAGKLEQYDTPVRLWETPANAFVAAFFGAAVVPAHVREPGRAEIAPGLAAPVANGASGPVRLVVRSGHLRPDPDGAPLIVRRCEYAGGRYRMIAEAEGGARLPLDLDQPAAVGETVRVSFCRPVVVLPGLD